MREPNVIYKLEGVTDIMEAELRRLVDKNLFEENCKMSSSLKKICSKGEDVNVIVRINVTKVSDGYNGNFKIEYDGISLDYDREGFEILADLVNHAFDNFKQRILAK